MQNQDPSRIAIETCATEPIHLSGAVQPHGCLLLARPGTGEIVQASANAAQVLGVTTPLLGQSLLQVLGKADFDRVIDAGTWDAQELQLEIMLTGNRHGFLAAHHLGDDIVVELEEVDVGAPRTYLLDTTLRRISGAADLQELVEACSAEVRLLTGFDRVVVYRFDDDDHGEVIAESRHPALGPYLGHHFPESDIPRQARALYLQNWIRCIPDAAYTPVPLVPSMRPGTAAPLDLSGAHLRSVSPIHLEYLANMGVRASMSVSLIVAGRLWGLISCGHRTAKPLWPKMRGACESIGRMVSHRIAAMQSMDLQRMQAAASEPMSGLLAAMRSAPGSVLAALLDHPAELMALVGAQGVAVVEGEHSISVGHCPVQHDVLELARFAQGRSHDGLFCTRQLPTDKPGAPAACASGLLAVTLPGMHRSVLWFRPEIPRVVLWGGDPRKAMSLETRDGAPGFRPRRSFEIWEEEIRGTSVPWHPAEQHLARELRRYAIEVDLEKQVLLHQAAVRARDDLVAVVSHDLRTPVSVIAMQAVLLQRFLNEGSTEGSKRLMTSALTIQRAADRMTSLLRDLLDLAKIEAGRFSVHMQPHEAGLLVHDACELMRQLAETRQIQVVADETSPCVVVADAERVFQVFSNLISNSIKFSAPGGVITVGAVQEQGACVLWVADTGQGMTPEQLAHIFERFWQGKSLDESGAGLGLYICKGIIEAHGGRIWAHSEVGRGTTVRFSLPCVPGEVPEREPPLAVAAAAE